MLPACCKGKHIYREVGKAVILIATFVQLILPAIKYLNPVMRINSTQKIFLLFILGTGALLAFVYYLAFVVPVIGQYVYVAVIGVACLFVLYVSAMPLLSFLSERAANILNVYLDETGAGIHIFSAYTVSRYKLFKPPIRYIQHYFIVTVTGKLYYKILFSHQQRSITLESGYSGFSTFEASVLKSEELKRSIETFSKKTKMALRVGKHIGKSDADHYHIQLGDRIVEIKKIKGVFDDVFVVTCQLRDTERLAWKRKI